MEDVMDETQDMALGLTESAAIDETQDDLHFDTALDADGLSREELELQIAGVAPCPEMDRQGGQWVSLAVQEGSADFTRADRRLWPAVR